jgi:adenine phosphoribosyltransferase
LNKSPHEYEELLLPHVRPVPDFPKPGILFYDLNPIYADAGLFDSLVNGLRRGLSDIVSLSDVDYIVAPDARGFIAGPRLASLLSCGFLLTRKPLKLPPPVESVAYGLEYGESMLEMSTHLPLEGAKVIVHDDVLATGGTAIAAHTLLTSFGADVVAFAFSLTVGDLNGVGQLPEGVPVTTVLSV